MLIGLVPIIAVTYPPTGDLPAHILGAVLHANPEGQSQTNYLSAEWVPSPYILFFLLMYPLIKIFGYLIAAKLVLCIYLILFPVGALIYLRTFSSQSWFPAFGSFLFIYNYYFEFGFIPFCLGIPLIFITIPLTKNALDSSRPALPIAACSILVTLIYFSHVINLISYGVGLLLLIYFDKGDVALRKIGGRAIISRLLRAGIILIPAAILSIGYLIYLLNNWTDFHTSRKFLEYRSFGYEALSLIRPFFSINHTIDVIILMFICGTSVVLLATRKIRIKRNFALYYAIVMIILGVVLPRGAFLGANDSNSRFVLIGSIAFLAAVQLSGVAMLRYIVIAISMAFLCIVAVRFFLYRDVDTQTSMFVQAVINSIPANQKIYTIYDAYPGTSPPPMLHSIAYYHIEKGGYSPFVFSDQRHVAGIKSSIHLPTSIENWEWDHQDTVRLEGVLKSYDYLVLTTAHSDLPSYFDRYADRIISRTSVCTIIKLARD